jgi:hypothetical protein
MEWGLKKPLMELFLKIQKTDQINDTLPHTPEQNKTRSRVKIDYPIKLNSLN